MQLKVEELINGSRLTPFFHGSAEASAKSLALIRESYNVPTHRPDTFKAENTHTVREVRIKRKYVYLVMGTGAILWREKGTVVEVLRLGPEETQNSSGDVTEDCGGAARRGIAPVSYARSQFDQVEDDSEFYRIQVRSNNRDAQTKWMNVSPAQFRAIREILAEGES